MTCMPLDIHEACRRGNLKMALQYLQSSDHIDDATPRGESPLWLACKFGHPELAQALVDRGADMTQPDRNGELPLEWVCQHGYLDLFKFMEGKLGASSPQYIAENHGRLFLAACKGGCIEMIEYVLTRVGGGDVVSALLAACEKGIEGVLKHLVRLHGVLHAACEGGTLEVVCFLIEQGANPAALTEMGQTTLHAACAGGHFDIVKYLVDLGGDCNAKDVKGLTPVHMACLQGSVEVVMYLVDLGADINDECDDGVSGLDLVCHEGHLPVVRYLLEVGKIGNINHALYSACEGGHLDVITYLVENGADIHFRHEFGETVLFAACQNGQLEVIRRLAELGADLGSTTSDGVSLLHAAAETGLPEVVSYLLEAGARPDIRTDEGKTPLHAAYEYEHPQITGYLLQELLKDWLLRNAHVICQTQQLDAGVIGKDAIVVDDLQVNFSLMLEEIWTDDVRFRLRHNGGSLNAPTDQAADENRNHNVIKLERGFQLEFLQGESAVCVGSVNIGVVGSISAAPIILLQLHDAVLFRESNSGDMHLGLNKMSI